MSAYLEKSVSARTGQRDPSGVESGGVGRRPAIRGQVGRPPRHVERTFSWLHAFKRPRVRWECRTDIRQASFSLACSVICLRQLIRN